MTCADHLREINDDGLSVLPSNENVELVEISVNESCSSETNEESHEFRVKGSRVVMLVDLTERVGVDEFHEDAVTRLIDGCGDGETVRVEDLARRGGKGG